MALVTFLFVAVIVMVASKHFRIEAAKQEFRDDPTNPDKKQALIETARKNAGNHVGTAFETMALIEEYRTVAPKRTLADDLIQLESLRNRGVLTQEEFVRAKERLMDNSP